MKKNPTDRREPNGARHQKKGERQPYDPPALVKHERVVEVTQDVTKLGQIMPSP